MVKRWIERANGIRIKTKKKKKKRRWSERSVSGRLRAPSSLTVLDFYLRAPPAVTLTYSIAYCSAIADAILLSPSAELLTHICRF